MNSASRAPASISSSLSDPFLAMLSTGRGWGVPDRDREGNIEFGKRAGEYDVLELGCGVAGIIALTCDIVSG